MKDWEGIADELASLARSAMHAAGWSDQVSGENAVPALKEYEEKKALPKITIHMEPHKCEPQIVPVFMDGPGGGMRA